MNGARHNVGRRTAAAVLAAIGAAAITAGCGSSSSGGTKLSAAATLKRAAYVSTAASGFKTSMSMRMSVNGTGSVQNVALTANGSVSPGTRTGEMTMSMKLPASAGGQNLDLQIVMDRNTLYMKLPASLTSKIPGGKPWLSMNLKQIGQASGIPGYGSLFSNSSSFSNPSQYLNFLRATADGSVKNLGQETVNGVQTTHYEADVDLAKLASSVPAAQKQAVQQLMSTLQDKGVNTQMPIDAWIDGSHHIRRLHIKYNVSLNGQSVTTDLTENLSDYGPQPAPPVPSADQTTNLTSMLQNGLSTIA